MQSGWEADVQSYRFHRNIYCDAFVASFFGGHSSFLFTPVVPSIVGAQCVSETVDRWTQWSLLLSFFWLFTCLLESLLTLNLFFSLANYCVLKEILSQRCFHFILVWLPVNTFFFFAQASGLDVSFSISALGGMEDNGWINRGKDEQCIVYKCSLALALDYLRLLTES